VLHSEWNERSLAFSPTRYLEEKNAAATAKQMPSLTAWEGALSIRLNMRSSPDRESWFYPRKLFAKAEVPRCPSCATRICLHAARTRCSPRGNRFTPTQSPLENGLIHPRVCSENLVNTGVHNYFAPKLVLAVEILRPKMAAVWQNKMSQNPCWTWLSVIFNMRRSVDSMLRGMSRVKNRHPQS
jgi:hypothetical protein